MRSLLDLPDAVARFLGRHGGWLFAVAVVITAFEVFMRYGLNRPQSWVHDLSIALCATGFLIAGPLAQAQDAHIRLGALREVVRGRLARVLSAVTNVAILAFLSALIVAAWDQALRSIRLGETTGRAWDVPIPVVIKTVLLLSAALLALQVAAALIRDLRGIARGNRDGD